MRKRKLTRRGSKRRKQLIDAALRQFAYAGYHGTTVGDICDELGVGKGVFYWYFDSKDELFAELLKKTLYELRRAQEVAIDRVKDPVERIDQGIRASIRFFRENPGYVQVIRTAARYEQFAAALAHGQEVVVADTALHIKAGMSEGRLRHGDPELMAHGILGALFHFVETYFGIDGDVSHDRPELEDEAAAFCLRGLLA
ncbi:MAG: TetR family transcriptional regulator [Actinobacteria bacterium]|nr:TetR family transcriptional regulator [Actinomycetota bacterium]